MKYGSESHDVFMGGELYHGNDVKLLEASLSQQIGCLVLTNDVPPPGDTEGQSKFLEGMNNGRRRIRQLDLDWQDAANCLDVDPDLFFPERGASTREAKEVCRACVVREDCLEFSLANGEKFGIWGGMSERERRRIRRQRYLERQQPNSSDDFGEDL